MHQTCKNTPVKPNTRNEKKKNIYIYIYGTVVATSCDLNAPRCTTTVPQVRLHGSRGGVFVGHRPPRDPGDPLQGKKFYIYSDGTHTHAPPRRGRWNENESEMTMKMKWTLPNQDAKRGTQKKRDRENTNTTHLARNGQTLKRQGKRKAEADGQRNKTSGGGGRTEAPEPT